MFQSVLYGQRSGVPFWYDLALILFFAWNGLMLGYASLLDMQAVLTRHFNMWVGWLVAIGSLVLGSFGIYLGRYLRWNSWDVISSPRGLLDDIQSADGWKVPLPADLEKKW